VFGFEIFLRRKVQDGKSLSIEKADIGDQLGLGIDVNIVFDIFKIDPFVMSVPTVQRADGVTVPIGTVVQENGRIALVAKAMNFDCASWCNHVSAVLSQKILNRFR
jgi:hypothetical protein